MPRQAVLIDTTGPAGLLSGFTQQSKGSVGIWMLAWPLAKQWLCCAGSRVAGLSLRVAVPHTLLDVMAHLYVLLLCSLSGLFVPVSSLNSHAKILRNTNYVLNLNGKSQRTHPLRAWVKSHHTKPVSSPENEYLGGTGF